MQVALENNIVFVVIEYLAILCWGLSGGLAAIRKGYDIFTIMLCGWLTALGGGLVRDVMLGALPPVGITDKGYVLTTLFSGIIVVVAHPEITKLKWTMTVIDALGLGLFAVKYNGKELDAKKGLNWYDYGARHYDAALGRFTTVDPSAENYYSTSPFTYCLNNPLNYIDPLGTDTVDVKDVDWNKFDPKKDVVALDEVAVSVPNALTKVGTRALEPISGFWGYVGYYLLDIGSTYHSEQTRFTYKVGTDGVITGVAPMVGTPPLPGFAKTSNLNTIRGLWSLTKQGSSKVMKHPIRGLFYKSKSDGLWWVKDQTKHGGSFYKVYKETNKGLEWHKDADKYGNFIINKHKSDVGIFIPWKELSK